MKWEAVQKFYKQKDIEIVGIDVYESQFVDVVCDAHIYHSKITISMECGYKQF